MSTSVSRALIATRPASGNYLNRVEDQRLQFGSAPLIVLIFSQPTVEDVRAIYQMLTPEVYSANVTTMIAAIDNFSQSLTNCRNQTEDVSMRSKDQCAWMRVSGGRTEFDKTFQYTPYHEEYSAMEGGVESRINNNWTVGTGVSYAITDMHLDDLAEFRAVSACRVAFTFAANMETLHSPRPASSATVWSDTERAISLGDLGGTAEATQQLGFASGRMEAAHTFRSGNSYLRAGVDGELISIMQYGFDEHGGGLGNMDVQDHSNLNVSIMPFLEAGSAFALDGGGNRRATLGEGWPDAVPRLR